MLEVESLPEQPIRTLKEIQVPRPLTHDLLYDTINKMGGTLDRVVVNDLRESTFFATLHLRRDGEEIEVDARPSDGVALAVRAGCPIYAEESVLDKTAS